jgi:hypothetical protein
MIMTLNARADGPGTAAVAGDNGAGDPGEQAGMMT